jgi:thioesterase domain-containing protein
MQAKELQDYLHQHIPLSAALEVEVIDAGRDGVVLRAPLEPNINHRHTVFGGSASALAVLSAWSLVHIRLREKGTPSRIVIQRNTTLHDLPIHGAFTARSRAPGAMAWTKFMRGLRRKGRARIHVSAVVDCDDGVAARFDGFFVALDGKSSNEDPGRG